MINKVKLDLINLGHTLEEERDEASQLWSWLPSCKEAEKYHGDYYSEFQPEIRDILIESNIIIRQFQGKNIENGELEWFECPCGDIHTINED